MKKYYNKLVIALCGLFFFAACNKNDTKITYDPKTVAPVLSANFATNDTVPLVPSDSLNTAITFSWTNPGYTFSNGVSSLNVNYTLQIDTVGSNFTNPNKVEINVPSALGTSFTVTELNTKLFGALFLKTGVPHSIAIRLESFLNQGSLPLYSNILTYVITPYAIPPKVDPPTTGTLFITGDATPDDWMVGGTPGSVKTPVNQELTRLSPTLYTITIALTGGKHFLLVPEAGNWDNKYANPDASGGTASGGSFKYNAANNFTGPSASGTYTITFNFQTGLYTITQ